MARPWRFYVYDVFDERGRVIYVGKGSGDRARVSLRERDGTSVAINAFFRREADAYAYEIHRIEEIEPSLNRHCGGNGSKAEPERKQAWEVEIDRVGTKVYAARLLLAFRNGINGLVSKVDIDWSAVEGVAYGSRP